VTAGDWRRRVWEVAERCEKEDIYEAKSFLLLVSMFVVFLSTGCGPSDVGEAAQQVAQAKDGAHETAPANWPRPRLAPMPKTRASR